ncbi:MAG: hypothetical protein L6R38_007229 [Xanthoria sp. 2 TBL-2021]|nr:MAG: hypothetical protein L6R38_007229 [Xanthoria sp. 2 TBL-2021]
MVTTLVLSPRDSVNHTLLTTAGLYQRALHPPSSLLSIHGSLFNIKCCSPQCSYTETDNFNNPIVPSLAIPADWPISDARFPLSPVPVSSLPYCPQCDSLLRPDIVWFGEQTPQAARASIHEWLDAGQVDLMLVVGTSATVWPAAIYIHAPRIAGARIAVFNTEEPDEEVDPSQRLREQDWFLKGDAAAVIPDVLKEVDGVVADTKCQHPHVSVLGVCLLHVTNIRIFCAGYKHGVITYSSKRFQA